MDMMMKASKENVDTLVDELEEIAPPPSKTVQKTKGGQKQLPKKSNPSSSLGELLADACDNEGEIQVLKKFDLEVNTAGGDYGVLMALFHSTNGHSWRKSTGWSHESNEWHGVKVNKLGRVVELNLSNNNLEGTIPYCMHLLTKLKVLDLSRNQGLGGEIPPSLAEFRHMSDLDLKQSNLVMPVSNLSLNACGFDPTRHGQNSVTSLLEALLCVQSKQFTISNSDKLGISWNQCRVLKVSGLSQSLGIKPGWVLYKIDGVKLADIDQQTAEKVINHRMDGSLDTNNNTIEALIFQARIEKGVSISKSLNHLRSTNQDVEFYSNGEFQGLHLEFMTPSPWMYEGNKSGKWYPFDSFLGYQLEKAWATSVAKTVILSKNETDVTKTSYEYDLEALEQHRLGSSSMKREHSTTRRIKRAKTAHYYDRENLVKNNLSAELVLPDIRDQEDSGMIKEANLSCDALYEFDFLEESLMPTRTIDKGGGLIGCDPNISFGASLLAPPGALPPGLELSLARAKPEEISSPTYSSHIESVVSLNVVGGVDRNLKSPVSMRLQHAFALEGDNPLRADKHLFVVTRESSTTSWERCQSSKVADKYAELTLPAGLIPSHVAIQSDDGDKHDQSTMVASVVVYTNNTDSAIADGGGGGGPPNGWFVVWVVPDRDDTRQAVAQRMARMTPQGQWTIVAESVEDMFVKANSGVVVRIDQVAEERVFKPHQGACFHCIVNSDAKDGTYAHLSVLGEDSEVDLYLPRPMSPNRIDIPPLVPEVISREDGGRLTLRLSSELGKDETVTQIVELAKLQVRDCATQGGQLEMPTSVPSRLWEVVYEGAMNVCMVEGGFACFIRSRHAIGGPWSDLLAVPPPGTKPILVSKRLPAGSSAVWSKIRQLVLTCTRVTHNVRDPNATNCQLLAHRLACAFSSLGNIPQLLNDKQCADGSMKLLKLFHDAECLIQGSACEGWLSRVLWPPNAPSDVFIALDESIFAATKNIATTFDREVGKAKGKISCAGKVREAAQRPSGVWYENTTDNGTFRMMRQQLCSVLLRSPPPPILEEATCNKNTTENCVECAAAYANSLSLDLGQRGIGIEEVTSVRFHEAYQRLITSLTPFPLHILSSSTSIPNSKAQPNNFDLSGSLTSLSLTSSIELPSIFISFSKEDGQEVCQFAHKLEDIIRTSNVGIPVLSLESFSQKEIPNDRGRSHLMKTVNEMVRSCDIFLAVLSASYGLQSLSPCSTSEISAADQALIPIVPLSFTTSSPGPLFGLPTANFKLEIDFTNRANRLEKMLYLCNLLGSVSDSSTSVFSEDYLSESFESDEMEKQLKHNVQEEEEDKLDGESWSQADDSLETPQIQSQPKSRKNGNHTSPDNPSSSLLSPPLSAPAATLSALTLPEAEETLESWLVALRLGHVLPALHCLGAEELSDLEFLDDDDVAALALKSIERKRFEKAKIKLMKSLGQDEESPRPKAAKRIDLAIKTSSDNVNNEKVWRAEVFGSMRFDASGPARRGGEAEQLKKALEDQGVKLHVVDISVGASITLTVFDIMERCNAFIAFGTKNYGEPTGNPAASDREIAYWQGVIQTQSDSTAQARPLIPIRMIPFSEGFDELAARVVFGVNALSLEWKLREPMPAGIVPQILRSLGLSELNTPMLNFEYADPTNSRFGLMLDELRKTSVPSSKCLAYWYGSLEAASQAVRSGIQAKEVTLSNGEKESGILFTLHRPNQLDEQDVGVFNLSREAVLICSVPTSCLKRTQLTTSDTSVRLLPSNVLTALQGFDFSCVIDPQPWLQNRVLLNPRTILLSFHIEKPLPLPLSSSSAPIASVDDVIINNERFDQNALQIIKPSSYAKLLELITNARTTCGEQNWSCLFQYIPVETAAFIIRNGITATSISSFNSSNKSGKILFTSKGPFTNDIGTPHNYEANVTEIYRDDLVVDVHSSSTSSLTFQSLHRLIVVYGCDAEIVVPLNPNETNTEFAVNNSYINSLALLDRDGKFHLRRNRILAILDVDTSTPAFTNDLCTCSAQIDQDKANDLETSAFLLASFRQKQVNEIT